MKPSNDYYYLTELENHDVVYHMEISDCDRLGFDTDICYVWTTSMTYAMEFCHLISTKYLGCDSAHSPTIKIRTLMIKDIDDLENALPINARLKLVKSLDNTVNIVLPTGLYHRYKRKALSDYKQSKMSSIFMEDMTFMSYKIVRAFEKRWIRYDQEIYRYYPLKHWNAVGFDLVKWFVISRMKYYDIIGDLIETGDGIITVREELIMY